MSHYDDDIRQSVSKLNVEDKHEFIESLFNGMINAMIAYHRSCGKGDREIDIILKNEITGIKTLVSDRVRKTTQKQISRPKEPTDDQFVNDATIDMNLILAELLKGPKKTRKYTRKTK